MSTNVRRQTRTVNIGSVAVGSEHPIAVQTMWDAPIEVVDASLVQRINKLKPLGCSIIRFGVPRIEDVEILGSIADQVHMPVVADIHFDYRIALRCLDFNIAKLRLNPGNIGAQWKVDEVIEKAKDKGVAIRIGINGGSLGQYYQKMPNRAEALAQCAFDELEHLVRLDFDQVVISVKDSNPHHVLEANRILAKACDYPLHLGVTEAGPLVPSLVKSSFFLGKLLEEGIGDTMRISISDDIEYEIMAARQLIGLVTGNDKPMPQLISCPRCARACFDTHSFVKRLEPLLYTMEKKVKVAAMGCVVNGPGEAGDADIAITGAGNKVFVYKHGERVFSGNADEAENFFMNLLENW